MRRVGKRRRVKHTDELMRQSSERAREMKREQREKMEEKDHAVY